MPQVPALPGSPVSLVDEAFSTGGPLARALPAFEPRDGQRQMARAVADVLHDGGVLLAEAGTGTGKTLAYLVPAILSGHRVLVSTGTKHLQEQIMQKDLPALATAFPRTFTAAVMKGRANYLCLHRLGQARSAGDAAFDRLAVWAERSETGDRTELADLADDSPLWGQVAATAETCLGSDCPQYQECFVTRMRQRAAEADVVVVNHHLLCADATVRHSSFGEVIPECAHLIVDEAHQLEDIATHYFGVAISNHRVDDIVRDGDRLSRRAAASDPHGQLARAVSRVADSARVFFAAVSTALWRKRRGTDERLRISADWFAEVVNEGVGLGDALTGLAAILSLAGGDRHSSDERVEDALALARRATELHEELRFVLAAADAGFVFFVEMRGRGVFLRAAPIDVASIVQEQLFDRMRSTVLTSATLAVAGSFAFVRQRLGIQHASELRVASEFDFAAQTLLYLPPRMPDPRAPEFADAATAEIRALLAHSRGRAFVLFTSYSMLRAVHDRLAGRLEYPLLTQGSAPRHVLLEEFRRTPHAVLLATSGFWQGVDVAGEQLSCVIVDKLPFASPADPVVAARIEAISADERDAFNEFQVPLAILTLLQGLGRLIRHRDDRGVLAVLDGRLRTKGYGRRFLDALPPSPVTHRMADVERFFAH